MNKQIWKFVLQVTTTQLVPIPYGGKILCVQMQNGVPCLWVMVDPEQDYTDRTIDIFGTGHDIVDLFTRTYIGTVQQMDGALIWHVFERHT